MSEIGPSTPERRVLGELSNTKSEPISPTANLRLLTSLASNLKSVIRSEDLESCQNRIQKDQFSPATSGSGGLKIVSRKQKSLGLLCNKFLDLYPLNVESDTPHEISLDSTAISLGTEKRRIYDIINVLESLDMASKAGKNRYLWHGQNNLTSTLARLKSLAVRLRLREQIQEIQKTYRAYIGDNEDTSYNNELAMSFEEPAEEEIYDSDAAIKEDKSLGAMCQKFIMLFLVSVKNGVINLDIAAKVLILDADTPEVLDSVSRSRFRTKVRRLYDIANVLTAIGIIKKVSIYDRAMKKPIFKYIGPEIESIESITGTPIHQIYNSPIGMSTPNKRITPISRGIHLNTLVNSDFKTLQNASNSTPLTDKRKPRKRKLFDTDSSFPRTYSLPNLDKNCSAERLDDSILRVAEMELKKLNSSEESQGSINKPKACTKLFPRCNSDSCLRIVSQNESEKLNETPGEMKSPNQTISFITLPLNINNNQRLVSENGSTATITIKNSSLNHLNIAQRPVINIKTTSITQTPGKNKILQFVPVANIASLKTTDTKQIIIPRSALNANKSNEKIPCYKVQTEPKAAKIINLTKINPSKLIPIKRSDLKIPLTTAKPQQVALEKINNSNTNYAMLTPIQASKLSVGDTFKAIQVGNTLQLVPMNSKSDENSNYESNNITN